MVRGDVHRFRLPKGLGRHCRSHLPERSGAASFRPEIEIAGSPTRVLVEQLGAVDARRIGSLAGHLSPEEMWGVDKALGTILGLR